MSSQQADGGGGFEGGGEEDELDGTGASGGLSLLAHLLVDLGAQMGARLDAFSIGPVAAGIGGGAVPGLLTRAWGGKRAHHCCGVL